MFVNSGYIEAALKLAQYKKLEDGTFRGEILAFKGVVASGKTRKECETKLQSVLNNWVLVRLRMGHELPSLPE